MIVVGGRARSRLVLERVVVVCRALRGFGVITRSCTAWPCSSCFVLPRIAGLLTKLIDGRRRDLTRVTRRQAPRGNRGSQDSEELSIRDRSAGTSSARGERAGERLFRSRIARWLRRPETSATAFNAGARGVTKGSTSLMTKQAEIVLLDIALAAGAVSFRATRRPRGMLVLQEQSEARCSSPTPARESWSRSRPRPEAAQRDHDRGTGK